VSAQQAAAAPGLHRVGRYAEQAGSLGQRQQAGFAQPLVSRLEAVFAPQPLHHTGLEAPPLSRDAAATIEDVGDLGFSVLVEERVDLGDDLRRGLTELPGVLGEGERQAAGGAATEADPHDDLVPFGQRDVLEKQACHAFALALRSARVVPHSREVFGQRKDLLPPLVAQLLVVSRSPLFQFGLSVVESAQLVVPLGLEHVHHEAVARVGLHEATAGEVGLVAGSLDALTAQGFGFVHARLELVLYTQRNLEGHWADGLYKEFPDSLVDAAPWDGLARGRPGVDALALADVGG